MEQVSACLVTRGDVEMQPIIDSLPKHWEVVIWDNSGSIMRSDGWAEVCSDLAVYGRYAAIEHASHDVIYVQDDDVIVSDPQAIVDEWVYWRDNYGSAWGWTPHQGHVACNMPPEFRHDFYTDNALVGFGGVFHRDLPTTSFSMVEGTDDLTPPFFTRGWERKFYRTCDIVVTALADHRVLVDIPITHLPHAYGQDRMYREERHIGERTQMRSLMRNVKR